MPLKVKPTRRHNAGSAYRRAMPIIRLIQYPISGRCYPLCPRCNRCLDREYMAFCCCCGQKLSWKLLADAIVIPAPMRE